MAWWRSPEPSSGGAPAVPYAPYVLAPNARTDFLHAHAVTITPTQAQLEPQLGTGLHFNLDQGKARNYKNAVRSSGNHGDRLFIYLLHFIRSFHSRRAILRSSSVQDKRVKIDIPNVNNNSRQLALAARGYQIILWRPSLVVIDVGRLRKVRGIFETFDMANHLPSRLCFDLMNNYFCKNFDGKREGHQWRIQREGFERGRISKRYQVFENYSDFAFLRLSK